MTSAHTASSESVLTWSVSGCCLTLEMTEWETVDKESDVKNLEVNPPLLSLSLSLSVKGAASCRGMPCFKWASSICGCVMAWKNNCAAPYKEAVCTFITLLLLLWQAAVLGWEVNASYALFIVPSKKCLTDLMYKVTDKSTRALWLSSSYIVMWKRKQTRLVPRL